MQKLTEQDLEHWTGTENYYKSTFGKLNLTDGMHYLREKANSYWLIDIIESVQHLQKIKKNKQFIVWKIEVFEDDKFKVSAWSDTPYDSENLYTQIGEYTDFPIRDLEFYQCEDILLLKGEY